MCVSDIYMYIYVCIRYMHILYMCIGSIQVCIFVYMCICFRYMFIYFIHTHAYTLTHAHTHIYNLDSPAAILDYRYLYGPKYVF